MNKEDWLRLLEKVIDDIPETVTAIASLITAITVYRQTKNPQRKKVNAWRVGKSPFLPLHFII